MTREYEPAPTTKVAQKEPQKHVENLSRILGLWENSVAQFARPPKYPKRAALDGHFHIQTCDLSDVMGNSLASLGRALRVRKTAVCRDHFQLHAWWARTTITR
jgi:hypothetical protein